MKTLPALLVTREALERDPALRHGGRGARKILVTGIFAETEMEASDIEWSPPSGSDKCPVRLTAHTEVAVFNGAARQDRHFHEAATEIYMVMEGSMVIEVEGVDYRLKAGDMIVVNPGAAHLVKTGRDDFLCRLVSLNCGGAKDKYLAP
ncbi:MAG TPA: cupin domain-containing protein [Blastocatellia bacterium]|jgi:quercetin dioxygenase-like cupin family protein|nr:cupin domain-containing protein [Blastocatellia bacterium]